MNLKIYLLRLEPNAEDSSREELLRCMYERVDESRQAKADRIKAPRVKITSLAAGLLLQKMMQDGVPAEWNEKPFSVTIDDLLAEIEKPVPIQFMFGENGKPYLTDSSMYFSLSHSGDYILLAVSDKEIGADIQEKQPKDVCKLANRFFAPEEARYLSTLPSAAQQDYFYHLWTSKEACTKLLGDALGEHLADDIESAKDVLFFTIETITGYSACICTSTT